MNASWRREIAGAIIIDTFGRFLLQQRDDILGIIHPGKVGLFGGHREFFIARNIPVDALVVIEGSPLIMKPRELIQIDSKLTPSAKFGMKAYLDRRMFA
jgi:8-oxo-dGTP diphosphatase